MCSAIYRVWWMLAHALLLKTPGGLNPGPAGDCRHGQLDTHSCGLSTVQKQYQM